MDTYINEIKGFYDFMLANPLTSSQIALWHALMHINNKCAWSAWFTAPNRTLELLTGMERSSIIRARNVLKQLGLLDFKANGTKATSYHLITCCMMPQQPAQEPTQQPVQEATQEPIALNRLDKTRRDKTNKRKENIKEKIESYTNNDQLREALYGYVDMRKVKKKPPTDHAFDLILRKLDALSAEKDGSDSYKIAILEMSILKGWTDVYAVDDYQPPKPERDRTQDDTLQRLSAEYESKLHQHLVDGGSPFDFPPIEEMYPEYWRESQ